MGEDKSNRIVPLPNRSWIGDWEWPCRRVRTQNIACGRTAIETEMGLDVQPLIMALERDMERRWRYADAYSHREFRDEGEERRGLVQLRREKTSPIRIDTTCWEDSPTPSRSLIRFPILEAC